MALQGTLKDFSITDIFQLIGQQGKSGTLTIVSENRETQIVFDKGSVVLGRFVKAYEELKLGTLLLRANMINTDQLNQGLAEHRRIMKSLGDVLLMKGWITEQVLSEFLALQTREVLFRVLQWKSGAYKFKAEDFPYNRRIITPISSDFLLMDGVRQLDEWPSILTMLGSLDHRLELTSEGQAAYSLLEKMPDPNAPLDDIDSAFAEFDQPMPVKKSPALPMDEKERKIFPLVASGNSLQQIIDLSRLGTFDGANAIAIFIRKGWATLVTGDAPATAAHLQGSKASLSSGGASLFLTMVNLLLPFIFGILAMFLLFKMPPRIIEARHSSGSDKRIFGLSKTASSSQAFGDFQQVERLKMALGVYFVETMDYPNDLGQLQLKDLLSPSDLSFVQRAMWHYKRSDGTYELLLTIH